MVLDLKENISSSSRRPADHRQLSSSCGQRDENLRVSGLVVPCSPSRSSRLDASTLCPKRASVYRSSDELAKFKTTGVDDGGMMSELSCSLEKSFSFQVADSLYSTDDEGENNSQIKERSYHGSCMADSRISMNYDGDGDQKRDSSMAFQKSLSSIIETSHFPPPLEKDFPGRTRSKSRFNPIRKALNPFIKAKSLNPFRRLPEQGGEVKTAGINNVRRMNTMPKPVVLKEDKLHRSVISSSPTHLRGSLKMEARQGVPCFEFTLSCPEEILFAKTWKEDGSSNSVYTFHSIPTRSRIHAGGGMMKEAPLIGQMQASGYLCSRLEDGVLRDYMVAEFVLHDLAHAGIISDDSQDFPRDVKSPVRTFDSYNKVELEDFRSGLLCPNPLPSLELRPEFESAAIVIELPVAVEDGEAPILKNSNSNGDCISVLQQVRVVIPTGSHGLPVDETSGPSSLSDRWRFGGGCDCGGWDMGCPLTVLSSYSFSPPMQLLFQGLKQSVPGLKMTMVEEGKNKYGVDFHAQLSSLQAFSISLALLHVGEMSRDGSKRGRTHLPLPKSTKLLIGKQMKLVLESLERIENDGTTTPKGFHHQSLILDSPFSPISRV